MAIEEKERLLKVMQQTRWNEKTGARQDRGRESDR